jgi:replicative DNA helicase
LRTYPSAPMAEKAVLCAIVNDTRQMRRIRAGNIAGEHFHNTKHQTAFLAMGEWIEKNPEATEVDFISFAEFLRDRGKLELVGGVAEFSEWMTYAPQAATNLSGYCQTLREMRARRMAIAAADTLSAANDSGEAITAAREALDALQRAVQSTGRAMDGRTATREFLARFLADAKAGDMPGKPSGIEGVDETSGGLRPGELWIIGGKTSAGKSVLLLQIAAEFAMSGNPVVIFSLEMMAHEIVGRLVSHVGRVPLNEITQPRTASKYNLERITSTVESLKAAKLWIDASAGQTVDTVAAEAERLRDLGGLALVVVDYLQLVRGNRARGESREEEIARVSGALKQLAKELACPVLSATQLNEEGKTRESRAIAHDADALLIIEDDGLRVAKMRNGERGQLLPLKLCGAIQRFG